MEILIREEVNVYSIYIQINGTAVLNKRYHTHSSSGSGLEPQLTKSVFNQTDPPVRSSTVQSQQYMFSTFLCLKS